MILVFSWTILTTLGSHFQLQSLPNGCCGKRQASIWVPNIISTRNVHTTPVLLPHSLPPTLSTTHATPASRPDLDEASNSVQHSRATPNWITPDRVGNRASLSLAYALLRDAPRSRKLEHHGTLHLLSDSI